jgi:hypothetical protein
MNSTTTASKSKPVSDPVISAVSPNGHDAGKAESVGDIFDDLDALRVDQNYGSGLRTRKPFTQCPIRKPRAHEWFRVSRDLSIETLLFEHKEEMSAEFYLPVGPVVQAELEGKHLRRVRIYVWINRKGSLHIWPCKLPDREGKTNDWDVSSAEACIAAQSHWTQIENTGGGWQAILAENDQLPDPEWPPHSISQILRVAFKGGRVVEDLEHPLIDRLRGRV